MTDPLPTPLKSALGLGTIALFALYTLTLAPTVHWLDSGELSAAAFSLSIPHPPGEPLWVILAKLIALIPIGDIAYRINLASAAAGALVFPATFFCFWTWTSPPTSASPGANPAAPPQRSPRAINLLFIAALAPTLTYPLWVQGIRAEVYALNLALTLMSLAYLGKASSSNPRVWMSAALFGGLAASVHPLLAGLAIAPAIAIAALSRGLPKGAGLGSTAFFALLGLSPYAILPLRTAAGAPAPWGTPDHLSSFLDVILARSFQQNFASAEQAAIGRNLLELWDSVAQGTGLLIPGMALIGVTLGLRRGQGRAILLAMLAGGATLWAKLTQTMVFATNVDLHGYLGIVHIALWGLAALGLYHIGGLVLDGKGRLLERLPTIVLGSLALMAALLQGPLASRSGNDLPLRHGQMALSSTPPGGTFLASGNNTMFVLFYLEQVEDARPDIHILSRSLMGHPWYQRYKLQAPRPMSLSFMDQARRGPKALYGLGTPFMLEAREKDIKGGGAAYLCPGGLDGGWGFYQISPPGRCPPPRVVQDALGMSPLFDRSPGDIDAQMITGYAQVINKAYQEAYLQEAQGQAP